LTKTQFRLPDFPFTCFQKVFQLQHKSHHILFGVCLIAAISTITGCGGSSNNTTITKTPSTLAITTSSLQNGQVGVAYSATLAATGGTAPYSWTLASGSLPAGLVLNGSSGAIAGTPTATANASPLTFKVTDSGSPAQSQTVNLTLTISAAGTAPLAITTTSLPKGQVSVAYNATLAATGGTTPYTWSLTTGSLPAGLSLNALTGAITGTPTVTASAVALTLKVTDSGSPAQSQTAILALTVNASALLITTTSLPNGQVRNPYSASLVATGGMPPYTWAVTSGSLPAGLTLNPVTGAITGTPTATANATALTFSVTDSGSPLQTQTVNLALTIAPVSFTLVQHTAATCTSSPCADDITPTTAGDLLVLWSAAKYSGTGTPLAEGFTAASGDSSWTHCPNQIVNYIDGGSTAYALDCWYILSATGGAASVSATWTFAGLTAPTYAIADEMFELQPSSTPVYYDTGNASDNFINCSTACTGPAALLSGSDAVLQATMLSSLPVGLSSPYTTPDILSNVDSAFASALGQSSYSQPTWQGTDSSNPNFYSTAAFGTNPTPPETLDYLIDFSACTAGSSPTVGCLSNSTFTGANQTTPLLSNMGPNLMVTNSGPSSQLPIPVIINGSPKMGKGPLSLGCTTSGSGRSCGPVDVGVNMVPMSISIGYTVESSCPATGVDCSAIGGIFSKGGVLDFDVVHFSPLGNGMICFETQGGSGCAGQTTLAYSPNTAYRVNMQINNYPATTNYITVCADGPGGTVLGTWSNGATAGNAVDDVFVLGVSGEEPAVAGYTYSWRNVVVSFTGQFSTTSCF